MESFITKAHKRISDLCRRQGLNVNDEEPVGRFSIDIYLPEWHLGIEVDGPTHSPRKDERRDGELWADYGLPILRLRHDTALDPAWELIEAFIVGHHPTVEARKRLWLQKRAANPSQLPLV